MKSLREYLNETEETFDRPARGDNFAINIREECLLETYVCDETEDGIVLHADEKTMSLLESYGFLENVDAGEYDYEGDMAKDDLETIVRAADRLRSMLDDNENMPEWVQSKINKAADYVDTAADYIESNEDDQVAEAEEAAPNPVARAVLNRILMQHPGVIATHGPAKVMDAIDELADYVNIGPDDEIGSSDVSGWTRDVIRMLAELPDEPLDEQGVAEDMAQDIQNAEWFKNPANQRAYYQMSKQKADDASRQNWQKDFSMKRAVDAYKGAVRSIQVARHDFVDPVELKHGRGSNDSAMAALAPILQQVDSGKMTPQQGASQINAMTAKVKQGVAEGDIDEAKYQGREVPLGKPMKGDVAKSKVYVRDPKTGNVKKVNFGDPNMKIKKNNPARRKSFRARHNCDNPGPRTKARYWSCRAW